MAQRWIRDPFLFNLDSMDDNDMMKDDLVELQTNDRIPMEFEKNATGYVLVCTIQNIPTVSRESFGGPRAIFNYILMRGRFFNAPTHQDKSQKPFGCK